MKRFLFLCLLAFSASGLWAQHQMWVGEYREFDVSSSVIGSTRNLSWTTNGGYFSLTGAGFYRGVTITQYFSGSADIICTWEYQLYYGGPWTQQRKTFTITCVENPVSINPTTLTLAPGQTYYLSYSHKYSNQYTSAANAYFSSDGGNGAISVTRNGLVTANKVGQAYVNVYSKISSGAPYCLVTVKEIEPTGVAIPATLTLVEGESATLKPTLYPDGATSSYSWRSDDVSIAKVNSSGLVSAVKQGKTKVRVTTSKGGYTDYCDVTVKAPPVPPVKVELPEKVLIYKGFSTVLTPVLEPVVAETTYKWSTDNSSVVSVSSVGKVTAKSIGEARVTVTTANNLTATTTVVVSNVPDNIDSDELMKRVDLLKKLSQTTLNYAE